MNTPPSSPITTTITITIAPSPPQFYVGVSQPHVSIPFSTPLFTDSTSTTTTIVVSTPEVTVNVSNTGEDVNFGVTVGPNTSTALPFHYEDPDIVFGDDRDTF